MEVTVDLPNEGSTSRTFNLTRVCSIVDLISQCSGLGWDENYGGSPK